jgi:hypothetical protein
MQPPTLAQFAVPRHASSAFSASERSELVMAPKDVLTTFLHWAALIPERDLQVSAFLQTSPARSLPPPRPQPTTPTANSPTATTVHGVLGIVDFSKWVPGEERFMS